MIDSQQNRNKKWKVIRILFFTIFCIISLLMLYFAPKIYSYSYCKASLLLFIFFLIPYLYYKVRVLGAYNFDSLFLFSFFCINCLHPVFIYPDDTFLPAFAFPYNKDVITYALSLALVGISFYMLGNVVFFNKPLIKYHQPNISNSCIRFTERLSFVFSISLFLYVTFFIRGSFQHLYPRLMILIVSCIVLSFYYKAISINREKKMNIKFFIRENRLNLISLLLFCLSLLMISSRGNIIFLLLSVIMIVNTFYFKIGNKYIIGGGIIGILVMCILMLTRNTDIRLGNTSLIDVFILGWEKLSEDGNFLWILLLDFEVNARTLYESIDYVLMNGYLYGVSYVQYLFCLIPGAGVFVTRFFFNKETTDVSTGYILTNFSNAPYGIGTNMIADLYMNFSVIGLIIVLFLFGAFVSKCECCNSKIKALIYCCLLGNSIYIPRASVFAWLDMFAFLILLDLIIRSLPTVKLLFLEKIMLKD